MALKGRRLLFCEEYLVDLNATQAYIRAGFAPKNADHDSCRLMKDPGVKAYIAKAIAARSRRTGITQDRVIRELARLAFVNAPDVIDFSDATFRNSAEDDDTAAIASVRVKKIPTQDGDGVEREIKLHDKLKALELLGKHLGMFTDNVHLTGDVGVTIVDDVPCGAAADSAD